MRNQLRFNIVNVFAVLRNAIDYQVCNQRMEVLGRYFDILGDTKLII